MQQYFAEDLIGCVVHQHHIVQFRRCSGSMERVYDDIAYFL